MDANSNTGGEEAFWDVWRSITSGVVFWLPSIRSKTQPAISKKKILSSSNEIHSKASAFLSEKKYIDFLYVLNVLFCVMETRRVAPPFSLDKI
jgi:hypothetical protein